MIISLFGAVVYASKGFFYWLSRKIKKDTTSERIFSESTRTVKLAIFSEGSNYWLTFKPIVRVLIEKHVPFTYYTMDMRDPALEIESEFMDSCYIGKGTRGFAKINRLQADIMVATTPNIGTPGYPVKRPAGVKSLVHVWHSFGDLSRYRKGSLDHYDVVLCVGDQTLPQIRYLEKLRGTKQKTLLKVGAPYLDTLAEAMPEPLPPTDGNTVLIASSWGSKGCFSLYGSAFLISLAKAGYNVIVRPHPQSLKVEKEMILRMQRDLSPYCNVVWDLSANAAPSMLKADLLISDNSGIRMDFAFLYERPVITLETPLSNPDEWEYGDLGGALEEIEREIGTPIGVKDIDSIAERTQQLLSAKREDKFIQLREKYIANFRHSGEAVANYLISALQDKATEEVN